jgi:glycine oxidase
MIPPGDLEDPAVHELARMSARCWPELSQQLKEQTGRDNGYLRCGALEFAQEANALSLKEQWARVGVQTELLDRRQLLERLPIVDEHWQQAVSLPEFAQVRNPRHLPALVEACILCGVQIMTDTEVTGWKIDRGRVRSAVTPTREFSGGQFLIASGAWSSSLLAAANAPGKIEPVRGQIVLLRAEKPLFRQVLELGSRYLVPRDDGRILVGSTQERAGFTKETRTETTIDLVRFAASLVPALASVPVERSWCGLRPWSACGRPLIGPVPTAENLFVAAGHFRAGLSNSPATSILVREMLSGNNTSIDLAPFAIAASE